jgi:hypothetical protein
MTACATCNGGVAPDDGPAAADWPTSRELSEGPAVPACALLYPETRNAREASDWKRPATDPHNPRNPQNTRLAAQRKGESYPQNRQNGRLAAQRGEGSDPHNPQNPQNGRLAAQRGEGSDPHNPQNGRRAAQPGGRGDFRTRAERVQTRPKRIGRCGDFRTPARDSQRASTIPTIPGMAGKRPNARGVEISAPQRGIRRPPSLQARRC